MLLAGVNCLSKTETKKMARHVVDLIPFETSINDKASALIDFSFTVIEDTI
jgi:hypothetical protein